MNMKVKELDMILSEALEDEVRKALMEQMNALDHLIDSVKSFPTLSGLVNKITEIEDCGIDHPVICIFIKGVTPEELINCCGGESLGQTQTKLMQGLHHDLEDNGHGNNFDIDIDVQGDENNLTLAIRISTANNELFSNNDTEEQEMDEKKEIILGDKKVCSECGKELSENNATSKCDECSNEMLNEKKDKKWIQKAIDPEHEGYCTPMTKKTCTPKRKALAQRLRKMAKKRKAKNESVQKKIVTLSEAEMNELIRKILIEGVPGIDTTKRVTKVAKDQNMEALKAVEKKIKDYLTFKGNDNPEFPNQIGMGDEKAARQNTRPEDEEVALNRGQGAGDYEFDYEPSKKFRDRQEKALKGSSEMGNPTDAVNAIKTDVGDKMADDIKKRKEAKKEEPLYQKEPVPVKTEKKTEPERIVNENVQNEIAKMKRLSSYSEKTQ